MTPARRRVRGKRPLVVFGRNLAKEVWSVNAFRSFAWGRWAKAEARNREKGVS
jgi:hypothetical protein